MPAYLTPEQFAERINRPLRTVSRWLTKRLVPGAEMVLNENQTRYVWRIPESAVRAMQQPARGRPVKRKGKG
jgi:hypothetical protein